MSNANKAKGTRWESAVRDFANSRLAGLAKAYRPRQTGYADEGDIHGLDPFILQAKDWKSIAEAMNVGLAGAVTQAENAGARWGVAVVKRRRRAVAEAYAVMRLADWLDFYEAYRRGEAVPDWYCGHRDG